MPFFPKIGCFYFSIYIVTIPFPGTENFREFINPTAIGVAAAAAEIFHSCTTNTFLTFQTKVSCSNGV